MPSKLFEPGSPDVLYVVDLSSYIMRAYHAVAPLSSPSGEPTHAVHGLITMLERLFRDRKPALLSICMDAGRQTFRKEMYSEYKANRPPAPDDLRVQIKRSEEIVKAWGGQVLQQAGVEADDLIASVTKGARAEGYRVIIVSADKDLMQLVGPDVLMWDTMRRKVFGAEEVLDRFKVPPQLLGDLLALMGDSSDNIPGVPSIGPKTAATLLNEYGSLEGVLSCLDGIKRKKLQETLREHQEAARMSRRLVALKDDCPVDVSREALAFSPSSRRDEELLCRIYDELGFARQVAALKAGTAVIQQNDGQPTDDKKDTTIAGEKSEPGASQDNASTDNEVTASQLASSSDIDTSPTIITNQSELEAFLPLLKKGDWSFEALTIRPDEHRGPLVASCLSSSEVSFYIPFEHRYVGSPPQLDTCPTLTSVLDALASGDATFAVHDVKRQLVLLHEAGIKTELAQAHDALLSAYLIDPERKHDVVSLGATLELEIPDYDKYSKEGRKKRSWDELEVDKASQLAALRGRAIREARPVQLERLEELMLSSLLLDVELPLAHLLAELEERGVLVDVERLAEIGKICEKELSELEASAHLAAGREFNVNSPRQLETILFDELGLKSIKRTKTARSTDAQTLETLSDKHPLANIILKLRQIAKLKGTYIDALPTLVRQSSGRIHGAWEQAVTATGRLSSTDPNLQNIPIRSSLGREIRGAFVAPPGNKIVSADYSQIELRVLAHLSQDERLLEAFQTGQDIHSRTAMEIFEVTKDDVTSEMRSRAKAVNFGVIYGQGESALAKSLGIERKEAAHFISKYFERYHGVRTFLDSVLDEAREGKPVHSMLGRRRVIPDIKSGHRGRRLAAERIAMNMPIQGSAADILKLAMLRLRTPVTAGTKMVLTVHDELVFEVPNAEVVEASTKIKHEMESAFELSVPLVVEVGSGDNWNEAH